MAAAGQLDFSMSADPKDVTRALDLLARKMDRVEKKMNKVGKASGKATKQASAGLADGARQAMRFAGALTGIASGVGLVVAIAAQLRREYEHLKRQQADAALAQMTVGQVRNRALLNLPERISEKQIDTMVQKLSDTHKVKVEDIWRGASSPLSAMGSLSAGQLHQALDIGVQANKFAGIDVGVLAGGVLDVMKGAKGATGEQSAGWLRQVGRAMRVTELEEQIRTVIPVLTSARVLGWTPETGAELGAYFTQLSADITGRQSSTGAIKFMDTLQAATTKGGALIPYKQFGRTKFRPTKEGGPAGLAELQQWYKTAPEDLRREFTTKMPGRARIKGAMLALIAQTPEAMDAWRAAQEAISSPLDKGVARQWTSWTDMAAAGPHEPIRQAYRTFQTFTEKQMLSNPEAMAGVIREELGKSLAAIPGVSDLAIKMAKARFELGSDFGRGDVMGAAVERLEAVRARHGYGMRYVDADPRWRMGGKVTRDMWKDGSPYEDTLPGGLNRYGKEGKHYWATKPDSMWSIGSSPHRYRLNPDYDPQRAAAMNELIESLKTLAAEVAKQNAAAGKPAPVEIVADKRPAPAPPVGAHTE